MKSVFVKAIPFSVFMMLGVNAYSQKVYELSDLSGSVNVTVSVDEGNVAYSVSKDGEVMIRKSPVSMSISNGDVWGKDAKVKRVKRRSVDEDIFPPLYRKDKIENEYNEMTISFKDGYSLIFRAFEDGMAYRFASDMSKPFNVVSEEASFNLPDDSKIYAAFPKGRMNEGKEDPFYSSFQNTYEYMSLKELNNGKFAMTPLLVETKSGAKYKLLIDLHGTFKPTGLQRTYPNTINFEGVHGLEELKWAKEGTDQVTYDVTFPFIRMVAGPVDYTQGAMVNANKENFRAIYTEPMSQGTRCRQLAEYVIFESPQNMLCDFPTNYEKEQECTSFIADVPTVWNETRPLQAKIGECIVMARRNGDVWYVGGLTNWKEREVKVDFSFLSDGEYDVVLFRDGINSDLVAKDYKKETLVVNRKSVADVKMYSGGGFIMKVTKK